MMTFITQQQIEELFDRYTFETSFDAQEVQQIQWKWQRKNNVDKNNVICYENGKKVEYVYNELLGFIPKEKIIQEKIQGI